MDKVKNMSERFCLWKLAEAFVFCLLLAFIIALAFAMTRFSTRETAEYFAVPFMSIVSLGAFVFWKIKDSLSKTFRRKN
ncbi:hypothetical protein C4569_01790 [Candidatus Parcubacteria bacterium]|nr:MAG: hypothetical protein C4569_01790 [Candidatus Parcubacteria bacterium]